MTKLIIVSIRVLSTLIYSTIYLGMGAMLYALLAKWFAWNDTSLISNLISIFRKFSLKKLTIPEITTALIIVSIIIAFTVHSIKIWRTDIEPSLTVKAIAKKFIPSVFLNLFSATDTLVAKPQLNMRLELITAHLIDLESDTTKWTKESFEEKQQYIIEILNENKADIENLELNLQFPFFVSDRKIIEERNVSGANLAGNFTKMSASPTLSVERIGKPMPMNFTVRAHRISPKGFLRILFVIENTELVKNAPPPGSKMANMLKSGKNEFIHGSFEYKKQVFEIYFPIEVRHDRSLYLGPPEDKIPPTATYIFALGSGGKEINAEAYTDSGDAHYDNGEFEKALKDYNSAIHICSENARAYNNRGILFLKIQQDYDRAISDFSEAINIKPKEAGYYLNRAIAYTAKGSYDKAISDYNYLIEIDPRQARLYNERGNAHAAIENYDMAIMDYTRAIELDGKLEAAYNNRGVEYSKMGQYDLAINDFNKAIQINPDYDGARRNLNKTLQIKQKNR